MLYQTFRAWLRLGYRCYFKRVYVRGLEEVDRTRPIIFAVNHPTAFIEPTLIGAKMPFPVHYMTRGDVFIKPLKWFFDATHQVPVYRFKDGFSNLRDNRSSFEVCHNKLLEYKKLLIFCEGGMKWEKRLRKVQPGAAKLALGTLEKNSDLPLVIYSLGINYDHPAKFQSDVMMEIGPAIELQEFYTQYRSDTRGAIRLLTAELERQLSERVIHIEREEDMPLAEDLWQVVKNAPAGDSPITSPFEKLKNFTERLNKMDSHEKEKLSKANREYQTFLHEAKMDDEDFEIVGELSTLKLTWLIPLGLVLYVFKLLNTPPFFLADYISKKSISIIEFVMSIKVVGSQFLYPIYLLLIGVVTYFLTAWWWLVLLLPLGGLGWLALGQKFRAAVKDLKLGADRQKWYSKTLEKRNILISLLNEKA
nr:1-acyl-sn-glycerol-3-phosphate acyltransferase [Saprospiraceae bacterium]